MRSGTLTVSRRLASLHFIFPFCQNQQFATHGMNASVVLGQPDFTTGTAKTTQDGMQFPTFVRLPAPVTKSDSPRTRAGVHLAAERRLEFQDSFFHLPSMMSSLKAELKALQILRSCAN